MLPLKQIGNLLGKNQLTEELTDNTDEPGKDTTVKFNNPFLPPANYSSTLSVAAEMKALAYIHFSAQIPSNHSTEVITPPPDFVS